MKAAVADYGAEDREVRLGADGRSIVFRGEITYGTAKELLGLIQANPGVKEIYLTSNGGLVEPALLVANAIQLRRATTFVPRHCVSACTFLFLGGQHRYLAPDAALGFHGASRKLAEATGTAEINRRIRERFEARGVASAFIQRALGTPGEQLWYPSPEELQQAGVIDGVASAAALPRP